MEERTLYTPDTGSDPRARRQEDEARKTLDAARERRDASLASYKPIDYDAMNRVFPKQKAALTRAINSGDPKKVQKTVIETVREWNKIGAWPDAWSRWQRALDDSLSLGWNDRILLEDIR